MKPEKDKIAWERVGTQLERIKRNRAWLAGELNIDKNAVYNWQTRGGVPMDYLSKLISVFDISADELIGDVVNSPNKDRLSTLSEEARSLIRCVALLDRQGHMARKAFKLHTGLLVLAIPIPEVQDLHAGQTLLEAAEREAEEMTPRALLDLLTGGDDATTKRRRS